MLIVQSTEIFRITSPTIVTIGTFDGVHLGHQKILKRLQEIKSRTGHKTVVLTFDPHPRKVLFPEQKDLKLLTLTGEKLRLLESAGVDVAVVYPFSKTFSEMDAEDYIQQILRKSLNVNTLVIGYDHRFGKNRSGDINSLRTYAGSSDFEVEEISALDIDHINISSSKIRKAIEEGNIRLSNEFLGHRYSLSGTVVKGKQLGRTLGYPTANIDPGNEDKLIPATGVYVTEILAGTKKHFGMMNIGFNPTTDQDRKIKCEVHIFDFSGDLYGQKIIVNFVERIRNEKKFSNLNELKSALDEDRQSSLNIINRLS